MSHYPPADTKTQWFQDNFPGATMNLTAATTVLVLHTTETAGWPDYLGGADAPTCTAHPLIKAKGLEFRQHFPDEKSARALENHPGGVETNALNCIQVELIGTCDPKHAKRWGSLLAAVGQSVKQRRVVRRAVAGADYIFWPDAPDWLLGELAKFVAYLHKQHGLALKTVTFLPYPASYGASGVRFTNQQWSNFTGICGHQHVPENDHGDPGNINVARLLELTQAIVSPPPAPTPTPTPTPTPVPSAGPTKAPKVKLGHPNKTLHQTEAFGDSDEGIHYFAKKGCARVDGNALPSSNGRLVNTHYRLFLQHGFVSRDGAQVDKSLPVDHFTGTDLNAKFWTGKGHYTIDSVDNRIRLAWSLGMDYELELKATATRAELQRLHDLFGHDPHRKVIVKTLLQRPGDPVGDLKPAHAVGFPTLLSNHRPFAKAPAAAKAWIDEWRGFKPRWI